MPGAVRIETSMRGLGAKQTFTPSIITLHATQAGEQRGSAKSSANWCKGPPAQGSCTFFVDAFDIVQAAPIDVPTWHCNGGNGYSVGIEFAGLSEQTAEQWADEASLAILNNGARVMAFIRSHYPIPFVRLPPDTLKLLKQGVKVSGVTRHMDWSAAGVFKTSHKDPGPNFPFDVFLLGCCMLQGGE